MPRKLLPFLLAALLTPSAVFAASLPPAPSPVFDPARFFEGHTQGTGSLKIVAAKRQPVRVEGRGRVDSDGVLVLDQTVTEGGKPPAKRSWTFRQTAPGRYTGTLSDAAGPVSGDVTGNRLHLHFRIHGGIVADQLLNLSGDGQSAHNRMTFRKFGVIVARLDETIRRV